MTLRTTARRGWSIKWGVQLKPNRAWLYKSYLIYNFTCCVRASVCRTRQFCLTRQFYGRTGLCIFYGRTRLCYLLALRVVVAERHTPARSWNSGPESQMQQHSRCKSTAAATEEESSVRLSRSWNPGPESQMQQHPTRADCVRPSRLPTSFSNFHTVSKRFLT